MKCDESTLWTYSSYSTDYEDCADVCTETDGCAYFNVNTNNGRCRGYSSCTVDDGVASAFDLYECATGT